MPSMICKFEADCEQGAFVIWSLVFVRLLIS